ncbi:hypothetical protein [Campylobacter troglodytis]|nr:hypothetical protein [Campylobacter troglodytis]
MCDKLGYRVDNKIRYVCDRIGHRAYKKIHNKHGHRAYKKTIFHLVLL